MKKITLILASMIFLVLFTSMIYAARSPTVGGDDTTWGTILNTFLNVSHNATGELRTDTVASLQIVNGTILDADISDTTNLTLGEKITFTFGEVIDNIVNGWVQITGGLNVRGQGNFSGTIYINNATDISTWESNVSRNWTLDTYNTWGSNWYNHTSSVYSTWNTAWSAQTAIWDATFNTSFDSRDALNQFNTTYDDYAYNVSRNWTAMAFDAWGSNWYNHTSSVYSTWNTAWSAQTAIWDATFNTSFDSRDTLNQFNTTYDDYAYNVSLNYTKRVYDNWNTAWTAGGNASWNESHADNLYWLLADGTYNSTYHAGSTIWDATFNTSFDSRDALNQFNTTYDDYAYNVSLNYTKRVYDNWNTAWTAGGNASWNESHADNLYWLLADGTYNSTYHAGSTIWDATFNTSFDSRDALNQFNTTYDDYAYNVSLNYTKRVYDNWNTAWTAGGNASWNESHADNLYWLLADGTYNSTYHAGSTIWDATFNTSFDSRDALNQFNTTYDDYAYNVSLNYTKRVYDNWNTAWSAQTAIWDATFNTSFDSRDALNQFNTTYDDYALNVSRNWTLDTYNTWGSNWYNHTSSVYSTWNTAWSAQTAIWDATFNTSFDHRDTLNQFNTTYDDYASNVSRNWTLDTYNTWGSNWYNHTSSVYSTWNTAWSAQTAIWDATFNTSFDARDDDTIFTPTNVAWINQSNEFAGLTNFTANVNMTNNNITGMDCIFFTSGGKICSGV